MQCFLFMSLDNICIQKFSSKRRFDEHQAEEWWSKNKDRVLRRYSPQTATPTSTASSSTSVPVDEGSSSTSVHVDEGSSSTSAPADEESPSTPAAVEENNEAFESSET